MVFNPNLATEMSDMFYTLLKSYTWCPHELILSLEFLMLSGSGRALRMNQYSFPKNSFDILFYLG